MDSYYYEDFQVGATFQTTGRTITEGDILQFAALTGDWNQVHTNEEYCKGTDYGRRIAHGLLGLALMEGMKYRLGHTDGTAIASLSWSVKFAKPIYIGDTVHVTVEIVHMRTTRKPEQGIITEQLRLVNQKGEAVTEAEHLLLLKRRPTG